MAHYFYNPFTRRNLILYAGLGMLAVAVVQKPSVLWFFMSFNGFFEVSLMTFVALFTAMGFYEAASLVLKDNGLPWYTRPGGLLLLISLVIGFFLVRHVLNNVFFQAFGVAPLVHERAHLYGFLGMTLLWIVFLERISCK